MHSRCYNANSTSYKDYGGRGIKICDEWNFKKSGKQAIINFSKWSYENGYFDQDKDTDISEVLSIERIDVNKDYFPGNCAWIPLKGQAKNTRTNSRVTIDGETRILSDWRHLFDIHNTSTRIYTLGWDPYDAITIPSHKTLKMYGYVINSPEDAKEYNGPRKDKHGMLRDKDGFIVLDYK